MAPRPSLPTVGSAMSVPPSGGACRVALHGAKLAEAERWLAERPGQTIPRSCGWWSAASPIVTAGRRTPSWRPRRRAVRPGLALFSVVLAGGLFAQWRQAENRRRRALLPAGV